MGVVTTYWCWTISQKRQVCGWNLYFFIIIIKTKRKLHHCIDAYYMLSCSKIRKKTHAQYNTSAHPFQKPLIKICTHAPLVVCHAWQNSASFCSPVEKTAGHAWLETSDFYCGKAFLQRIHYWGEIISKNTSVTVIKERYPWVSSSMFKVSNSLSVIYFYSCLDVTFYTVINGWTED